MFVHCVFIACTRFIFMNYCFVFMSPTSYFLYFNFLAYCSKYGIYCSNVSSLQFASTVLLPYSRISEQSKTFYVTQCVEIQSFIDFFHLGKKIILTIILYSINLFDYVQLFYFTQYSGYYFQNNLIAFHPLVTSLFCVYFDVFRNIQ